jgi:membrane protease YdiL (CAAX protease family)
VFLPAIVTADNKASLLLTGIVMGLVVGFFEELGWTGFAVPRLRPRYGVLATGLIVGFLWGAWHFPLFSGSGSSSGALPPALYLAVLLFSFLPPYRVLMVWVYDRTRSLLVVMLMHAPLAASQLILIPLAISGVHVVTYDLVFAAALWVFVVAVAVANRGQLEKGRVGRTR